MKIFLDDIRNAPEGWITVRTTGETIRYLLTGEVKELSLDHDLGPSDTSGYDIVTWIEFRIIFGFVPPKMTVHSANPVGRARMEAGIKKINELYSYLQKLGKETTCGNTDGNALY